MSPPAAQGDAEGLHRRPDKQLARSRSWRFRASCVVCARWCPTLPHPGGCSTIGAVRLSFRVRDGSGRFPVAVTTETTTWAVRQCSCDSVIGPPCNAHCVWLVVGLGVDRIVDARVYRIAHPPGVPTHARRVCVGGCCCLCRPISTSQLTDRCRSSTSGLSTQ